MKVADYKVYRVDMLPKGYVFTYADFTAEVNNVPICIFKL